MTKLLDLLEVYLRWRQLPEVRQAGRLTPQWPGGIEMGAGERQAAHTSLHINPSHSLGRQHQCSTRASTAQVPLL